MKLSKEERRILVELICCEQTYMIGNYPYSYNKERYKKLEILKTKIKYMEEYKDEN